MATMTRMTRRSTLRLGLGIAMGVLLGRTQRADARVTEPYIFSDTWGNVLGLKRFCEENGGFFDTHEHLVYCHFDTGGVTCDIDADECREDWDDRTSPVKSDVIVTTVPDLSVSVTETGWTPDPTVIDGKGGTIKQRER